MMSNAAMVAMFAAGTVVVGVGGYAVVQRSQAPSAAVVDTAPSPGSAIPQPPETPLVAASEGGGLAPATPPAPTAVAPSTPDAPDMPAEVVLPTLDLVRVDAGGAAVVAGTGPVASDVVLRLDGQEVATATTDRSGNFVSLFDVTLDAAPRILTLEAVTEGEAPLRAADSVIVAPTFPKAPDLADVPQTLPEKATVIDEPPVELVEAVPDVAPAAEQPAALPATAPAVVVPDTPPVAPIETVEAELATPLMSEDPEAQPDAPASLSAAAPAAEAPTALRSPSPAQQPVVITGEPAVTVTAPAALPSATTAPVLALAPQVEETARPTAPRLFRAGPSGITVVSEGPSALPVARIDLGIDAIAYDSVGDVQLTGTGQRDAELRIYLDNRPVQTVRVDETGAWSSPLPDIDSGVYTLRIDEITTDGTVATRIETPFQRTAPEIAAQLRRDGATAITVQPGYTLWAISEGYFGTGVQYVQLFEANRDQIRDPDLIYPGQVFALPTE